MDTQIANPRIKWWWPLLAGLLFVVGYSNVLTARAASDPTDLKPTQEYVVDDYANMLNPSFKQQIIDQEKKFKQTKQQPQIVVMTVKSTGDDNITDFADDLLMHSQWKFGKKGVDNGVLILFAQNGGKNNVRVSTGYGVEGILPDARIHQILVDNEVLLKSKNNQQVNQGLTIVFDKISSILTSEYANGNQAKAQPAEDPWVLMAQGLFKLGLLFLIVLVLPFMLIFWLVARSNAKKDDAKLAWYKQISNDDVRYECAYPSVAKQMHWGYQHNYDGKALVAGVVIAVVGSYALDAVLNHYDHHNHDYFDGGSGGGGFFGGFGGGSDDFGGGDDGGFFDGGGGGDFGGGGDSI